MLVISEMDPFGAEIEVDLSRPLTAAAQVELRRAFAEHHLLRFRGLTQLGPEDQIRVLGYLGTVLTLDDGTQHQFVANNDPKSNFGSGEISWHSDMISTPDPVRVISLHALEVADGASSTWFASAAGAFQRLPGPIQEEIVAASALHVMGTNYSGRNRADAVGESAPRTVHPLVRHHEMTGVPYVFATWQHTDSVVGLSAADSDKLLDALFDHLYDAGNILEHRWSPGDLVIWDNWTVQHKRGDVSQVGARVLRRVSVGTKTINQMYPEFAGMTRDEFRASISTASPPLAR